ncbi:MAG: TetR/AcrR family transcriptional regulator [Cyanobacteriota bacterium]|nr:TetR/AcrR family transcriptional regulator [Cyanobacteriota bacterium]
MSKIAAVIDTKEQILNVAERQFAEKGYAGTTLRGVIKEADVNIAAVHYHFGSKEELYSAVVRRVAQQIVNAQQQELAKYEHQECTYLEDIVEAFIAPPLRIIPQMGEMGVIRAHLMGSCRTEPLPIQQLVEKEFSENHQRFLDIFQRALPNQTRLELEWKLDMAIAVLVRTLNQVGESGKLIAGSSREEVEIAIARLVKFVAQGMRISALEE